MTANQIPHQLGVPMTPVKQYRPPTVAAVECQTNLDGEQFEAQYGKGKGFSCISQAS